MKRFLIQTLVKNAEGSQCWYVDANSEAEALDEYARGGCDLYSSEVDVTSLGEPEIVGETNLSDFGDFAPEPLYTSPPQRQPLSDEQINKKWSEALADTEGQTYLPLIEFARAIEAAVWEKQK